LETQSRASAKVPTWLAGVRAPHLVVDKARQTCGGNESATYSIHAAYELSFWRARWLGEYGCFLSGGGRTGITDRNYEVPVQ